MKVYIQYPWAISDSQYYKSLVESPPESVEYINTQKDQGMITNPTKFTILKFFKKYIRRIIEKINLPIPNAHKTRTKEDYNLLHCAHCLSLNKTNWVADFESCWQMWISGRDTKKGCERVLKILMKDNCKKVLAWTNDAKQEIASKFPEIKDKIEVVSFAMYPPKFKKIKHKGINLLFVGRYFYEKGGLHTLKVFDKLTKKYENVKCLFVSQTPKEILEKYSSNKKIKFYNLMPHQRLMEEIFPKSDILVYPGYSDTFGFIFIEAMSFRIPIVTVDGFARKEIVGEGKTGFVIDKGNSVRGMIEKTSKLIENKKLRERMSRNCIKTVTDGRFSIKERNEKMKKIYEEALR